MTKIEVKKSGITKCIRNNGENFTDHCPICDIRMEIVRDLCDHPSPSDLIAFSEKYTSMEATHYKCTKCGREFLQTEVGDYDYMTLREVQSFPYSWIAEAGKPDGKV